ncbi:ATP-binding protein [Streptomyces sp. NPDC058646]|uniref:ATP-binding protein n=1 Tax=Streptomyces sp. NPDC058646 TaxID=3346574 RepID=UPI003659B182
MVDPVPRTAMEARDRVRLLIEASRGGADGFGSAPAHAALTDALLVTSELVSNAIRHGGGLLDFSASVSADCLRIEVTDASGESPVVRPRLAGTLHVGGFGWPLVHRLARSVTIKPTEQGGKRIEVLVPLDGSAMPTDVSPGH